MQVEFQYCNLDTGSSLTLAFAAVCQATRLRAEHHMTTLAFECGKEGLLGSGRTYIHLPRQGDATGSLRRHSLTPRAHGGTYRQVAFYASPSRDMISAWKSQSKVNLAVAIRVAACIHPVSTTESWQVAPRCQSARIRAPQPATASWGLQLAWALHEADIWGCSTLTPTTVRVEGLCWDSGYANMVTARQDRCSSGMGISPHDVQITQEVLPWQCGSSWYSPFHGF